MIVILCVDDHNGMMFNKRRQSQDRVLRQQILTLAEGAKIWMSAYSRRQFTESEADNLWVTDQIANEAGAGEFCFLEDQDPAAFAEKIEKVILFRWNRSYPADQYFTMDLSGWKLVDTVEFAGSSHEKITQEQYIRA